MQCTPPKRRFNTSQQNHRNPLDIEKTLDEVFRAPWHHTTSGADVASTEDHEIVVDIALRIHDIRAVIHPESPRLTAHAILTMLAAAIYIGAF